MAGYIKKKKLFSILLIWVVGLGFFALYRFDSKVVKLSSFLAYGNSQKNVARSYEQKTTIACDAADERSDEHKTTTAYDAAIELSDEHKTTIAYDAADGRSDEHKTTLAYETADEPADQNYKVSNNRAAKFITNDGVHFDKYSAIEYTDDYTEIVTEDETSIDVNLDSIKRVIKQENENCSEIQNNPYGYWRSTLASENKDEDLKRLTRVVSCGGILLSTFLHTPVRRQLYPFEVSYLSSPPVYDPSRISTANKTWIKLVNSTTSFIAGDTVMFRIDVRDAAGRQKTRGGDRLKIWVTDVKNNHSIYAALTDFDNGTYIASTVLPWAGKVIVKALLAYPREYIRAVVYNHRVLKSFKINLGGFNNSMADEGVPCSPLPLIPGHKETELCNLTERNGSPWYCGRPVKPSLKCSDFQFVGYVMRWIEPLATPAERTLLKSGYGYRNAFLEGHGQIKLNVKRRKPKEERLPDPATACNDISARETRNYPWPTGYLYYNQWQPFVCKLPQETSQDCFKDTKILILGDSNGRVFYHHIQAISNCTKVIAAQWENWHDILLCATEKDDFSMTYMSHSLPFSTGKDRYANYSILRPTSFVLDSVPSSGRYLIFINHYLHFMFYHSSIYEEQLTTLVEPIRRLLDRNHDAHILLRAPHAATFNDATYPRGDNLIMVLYAIQRKLFRSLQDRLFYLPTWDITVAADGTNPHPKINPQIFKTMLGYLCGRKPREP